MPQFISFPWFGEMVKSESESCLVVSYSFQPHGLYMGPFPSPGDLPNPGIFPAQRSSQPRSPTLQTDSLPAEPPEKPKNTGMGSLSLLQQIFPTQDLNQGLLHWQAESLPIELSGKTSLAKAEKTRVSPFPSWWVSGVQQDSTWEVTLSESCRQDFSAVT